MSSLSRLSKKCQKCPYVDICQCKKMEAVAYISGEPIGDLSHPVITMSNTIIVGDGASHNQIMKSIEKELSRSIYNRLGGL